MKYTITYSNSTEGDEWVKDYFSTLITAKGITPESWESRTLVIETEDKEFIGMLKQTLPHPVTISVAEQAQKKSSITHVF